MLKGKQWLKLGVQTLLFMLIFLAVDTFQTRNMLPYDQPIEKQDQKLVSLNGEVSPLFVEGRRTLVYFFAPWCQICAFSIDGLNHLNDPALDVVAVALDYQSIEDVQDFVIEHELQKKVLLGHSALKQRFKIPGYPSYYLIDERGNVVAKSFGLNTAIGIRIRDWMTRH